MIGEAEYSLTKQAFNPNQPDPGIRAFFSIIPVRNEQLSEKEGRPIFEDTEFVTFHAVGDRSNVITRPVREVDKIKFAQLYDRFKSKIGQTEIGTPLTEWSVVTRSQVEELRYMGIHTIEQLAALTDGNAQKFLGALGLREKARNYIQMSKEQAPVERMNAELRKRDEEIASLKATLETISANMKRKDEEEEEVE